MKNYKKIVRAKERMSKMKKIISFVMVLAMIPLTSFIENEYFRAAIVLIIPIIFSRKRYGN